MIIMKRILCANAEISGSGNSLLSSRVKVVLEQRRVTHEQTPLYGLFCATHMSPVKRRCECLDKFFCARINLKGQFKGTSDSSRWCYLKISRSQFKISFFQIMECTVIKRWSELWGSLNDEEKYILKEHLGANYNLQSVDQRREAFNKECSMLEDKKYKCGYELSITSPLQMMKVSPQLALSLMTRKPSTTNISPLL